MVSNREDRGRSGNGYMEGIVWEREESGGSKDRVESGEWGE
jgi:hypothetical protein